MSSQCLSMAQKLRVWRNFNVKNCDEERMAGETAPLVYELPRKRTCLAQLHCEQLQKVNPGLYRKAFSRGWNGPELLLEQKSGASGVPAEILKVWENVFIQQNCSWSCFTWFFKHVCERIISYAAHNPSPVAQRASNKVWYNRAACDPVLRSSSQPASMCKSGKLSQNNW